MTVGVFASSAGTSALTRTQPFYGIITAQRPIFNPRLFLEKSQKAKEMRQFGNIFNTEDQNL